MNVTKQMLNLIKNDNYSIMEISKLIDVSYPYCCKLITKLSDEGILKKDVDKKSERRVIISLTEKGKKILKEKNY